MKPSPIWQDLPIPFKQSVVNDLDIKSRLSLQKCSKSDQNLVLSVPVFISSIILNPSPEDVDQKIENTKTELLVIEKPFKKQLYWKIEDADNAIEILKLVFNNPKLTCGEMIFKSKKNPAKFYKNLLEKVGTKKFPVDRLFWSCNRIARTTREMQDALKFFNIFRTEKLRRMELKIPNKHLIEELMKIEEFKSLHELILNSEIDNNQLEGLLFANKLTVQLTQLRVEDMKLLIETFLHKNRGSFFKIGIKKGEAPIEKLLESFKSMPNNSAVPSTFYEQDTNIHRFEILDRKSENEESLVLYVKIRKFSVHGTVCRVEHIVKDMCDYPHS